MEDPNSVLGTTDLQHIATNHISRRAMKLDPQRIFAFRLGVRTLLLVPLLIAALVEDSHGADCLRDDRTVTFPDGSSRIRSYACRGYYEPYSHINIGADIASASSTRGEFMKSSIRRISRGSGSGAPFRAPLMVAGFLLVV